MNRTAMGIRSFSGDGYKATFSGNTFSVTIKNMDGGAKDRLFAILPGMHTKPKNIRNLAGIECSGIMGDGVFISEMGAEPYSQVEASNADMRVDDIRQFLNTNPCLIEAVKIATNDPEQFSCMFQLIEQNPLQNRRIHTWSPNQFRTESDFQEKRVTMNLIKEKLVTGPDRALVYTIKAGCEVTLDFTVSSHFSLSSFFKDMVDEGLVNQLNQ